MNKPADHAGEEAHRDYNDQGAQKNGHFITVLQHFSCEQLLRLKKTFDPVKDADKIQVVDEALRLKSQPAVQTCAPDQKDGFPSTSHESISAQEEDLSSTEPDIELVTHDAETVSPAEDSVAEPTTTPSNFSIEQEAAPVFLEQLSTEQPSEVVNETSVASVSVEHIDLVTLASLILSLLLIGGTLYLFLAVYYSVPGKAFIDALISM